MSQNTNDKKGCELTLFLEPGMRTEGGGEKKDKRKKEVKEQEKDKEKGTVAEKMLEDKKGVMERTVGVGGEGEGMQA